MAFLIFNLILVSFDFISKLYADDDNDDHTCNHNVFSGSWDAMNALVYLLTRSIQSLAASFVCIVLFWKKKLSGNMFNQGRKNPSLNRSGIYGSDAAEILAKFEDANHDNISLTPESVIDDDDHDHVKQLNHWQVQELNDPKLMAKLREAQQEQNQKFVLSKKNTYQWNDETLEERMQGRQSKKSIYRKQETFERGFSPLNTEQE